MELAAFDLPTFLRGATQGVFDTMLSMVLSEQTSHDLCDTSRIVGSVSLAGKISGTINIHVTDPFAQQITANMLGMELDDVDSDEDVHDVILAPHHCRGGNPA